MSFAVIKTGGKQYKVSEGDTIVVEKIDQETGSEVSLPEVLLFANAKPENIQIGTPFLDKVQVAGKIVEHLRDDKKIVFKYKNKTRYKKKKGHRQMLTKIQITKITA
jgi:large subunit ribosomal protein L21